MAKVVVIDDRVTNRNILTRLALSVEEGLQVQAFASPIEALTRLQGGNPPDLIITDYNMPEMDGATFIETLREQRAFADVPIVVVTVYEDRDFCYRALDAGASGYLLKGSGVQDVVRAVREVAKGESFLSPGATMAARSEELTPREREVLTLLAEGHTSKEIGSVLDISHRTAEHHRARVMQKLGINDVAGLTRYAIRTGLVDQNLK